MSENNIVPATQTQSSIPVEAKTFTKLTCPKKCKFYTWLAIIILLIACSGLAVLAFVVGGQLKVISDSDAKLAQLESELDVAVEPAETVGGGVFAEIVSKINFEKSVGPDRVTSLSTERADLDVRRREACLSFNSIVNDKDYVGVVDPALLTDEDKQEIAAEISGFVSDPSQFFERINALVSIGKIFAITEFCAGDSDAYLIGTSEGLGVEIFHIVPSQSGISFEHMTTVKAFDLVYSFVPDYMDGVPLIWAGFGDAGYAWWEYSLFDHVANEPMLIESCNSGPVVGTELEDNQFELECRREYRK